jgi:NAD(P)-dependent dehydrogenase (short-subunit alcohol dehydrogenase family)
VVVIAARSIDKAQAARAELVAEDSEFANRLETVSLDVTSIASIEAAAESVGPLYALVNNAGVLAKSTDEVLSTNLLGPRKVCEAFLARGKIGHRIVMISSGAASNFCSKCSPERVNQLTADDITWSQIEDLMAEFTKAAASAETASSGFGDWDKDWTPYGLSKALLNSLTIQLARDHPHLFITACSPGMIRTDLFADYAARKGTSIDESIAGWGAKDPRESTVAPMFLLFGENAKSGLYYGSDGLRSPFAKYRAPGSPEYDGSEGR